MRLFQQTLQLVPKAHFVAGQLVLAPRHCSPEPLFRIWHEAQYQFLRHQPLDHPFAVAEIILPPARPAVGFGLAQMQCAGHLGRPVPLLARRLPVPLQRPPYRLPVLRGRFHHYFLDLLLDQPLGQQMQLIGGGAELAPLKLILVFPSDVSYHYRQHLLVHVDRCDSISHHVLLGGAESTQKSSPRQGHVAIAAPDGRRTTPNYSRRARVLRIKQANGLNISTAKTTSPAHAFVMMPLCEFFMKFRGPQAHPNRPQKTMACPNYPSPWGARGSERTRCPVASKMAFPTAGAIPMMGHSPAPVDVKSLRSSSTFSMTG